MAATTQEPKLVVIVGPTASGKSVLAVKIAKQFNGEIICTDSRTIYKGMDIGTAKPLRGDQKVVPHWGLDLLEPGQRFSAADFKKFAEDKIANIQNRGKLAIIVGGTGLYVDALLFDFSFVKPKGMLLHHRLFYPWYSAEKLQKMVAQRDWPMPENNRNRRHLLNTIRRRGQAGGRKNQPRQDAVIVGILPPDNIIKQRISDRANKLLERGIIEETRRLIQNYGAKAVAGSAGIAYMIIARLIRGEINQEQALELIKNAEWQYARRQKSWFKRNRYINWFNDPRAAYKFIQKSLLNT